MVWRTKSRIPDFKKNANQLLVVYTNETGNPATHKTVRFVALINYYAVNFCLKTVKLKESYGLFMFNAVIFKLFLTSFFFPFLITR